MKCNTTVRGGAFCNSPCTWEALNAGGHGAYYFCTRHKKRADGNMKFWKGFTFSRLTRSER